MEPPSPLFAALRRRKRAKGDGEFFPSLAILTKATVITYHLAPSHSKEELRQAHRVPPPKIHSCSYLVSEADAGMGFSVKVCGVLFSFLAVRGRS